MFAALASAAVGCGDDVAIAESETAASAGGLSTDAEASTSGSTSAAEGSSGGGGSSSASSATSATSDDSGGDGCGVAAQLTLTSPGAMTTNPVWMTVDAGPSIIRVEYVAEGVFPLGESADAASDFGVEATLMTLGPRTIGAIGYDACDEAVAEDSVVTVVSEEDGGDDDGDLGESVCFPGPANDWSVCFDLVIPEPTPYDYPPPLDKDPNYRAPRAFLDIGGVDLGVAVAPNFVLSELVKADFGDLVVVQPKALEHLQKIRDALGPIQVPSGFRNPPHNASVGGATWSRHMYGDAFDLYPSDTSLQALFERCATEGAGFRQLYADHVHCDWRNEAVDTRYFGPPGDGMEGPPADAATTTIAASIAADGDGWRAPASGYDEGEPLRIWRAFDGEGALLIEAQEARFVAPQGSARIEVEVGGALLLERVID
ncbi:MAG: D-Ala-D-Ala carboxypeptidase family metallohydrolase [Nannocystaceae bacterium]